MLNVVGKGCGLEKLQTVIDAVAHGLRDPDERRARGTHSLGEPGGLLPVRQRLLDMIGHSPRRSNLCTSTLGRHAVVGSITAARLATRRTRCDKLWWSSHLLLRPEA